MSGKCQSPLPRRLKEARKAAGYTQEKLGVEAGIDEAVASARMSQYENDVHTPDFRLLKQFSILLKVPTAYFYCEEDKLAELINAFDGADRD